MSQQVPVRCGEDTETEKSRTITSWEGFEAFPGALIRWYQENRRTLPWREDPSPYHVLVSEIMLQQTRVEAVKGYYQRFLAEFPDIWSLAGADQDRLLKVWEGLGYYSRVRNLQKAACDVCFRFRGEIPSSYEELLRLPGVGPYTAGAVASIAFGQPEPAVDGNVYRVLSRLRADERRIDLPDTVRMIRREVKEILPADSPGSFNQGLMELGALVCLPRGAPLCEVCPIAFCCRAKMQGTQADYPKKGMKKTVRIDEKTVLLIRTGELFALRKRPGKGLLAGMYEFPTLEGKRKRKEVLNWLKELGLKALRIKKLPLKTHEFTGRQWRMSGYYVLAEEMEENTLRGEGTDFLFLELERTRGEYPIPSAYAAYAEYLGLQIGYDKWKEDTN